MNMQVQVPSTTASAAAEEQERRNESISAVQTVLEQQGQGRIIHKPDGTIVWEPLPEKSANEAGLGRAGHKLLNVVLELSISVVLATSGVVAALSTSQHVNRAFTHGTALTSGQLTRAVTHTVASSVAGLITGTVLGPVRAATQLVGKVAGPAIGGFAIHRGVIWARRNLTGVVSLIKRLQSGDLMKVLDALRRIAASALDNEDFRKEFARFSGLELLLKMMAESLGKAGAVPGLLPPGMADATTFGWSPLLQLLLQAMEALLRSPLCRESCISAGGLPVILNCLARASTFHQVREASPSAAAGAGIDAAAPRMRRTGSSMTMSSYGSSSDLMSVASATPVARRSDLKKGAVADAQPRGAPSLVPLALACLTHLSSHPTAREAIREAGGVPVIVSLLPKQSTQQVLLLLQALAADTNTKDAIGMAGGVASLFHVIQSSPAHSQVQADAVATLCAAVRGSPANQLALAHVTDSFVHLHACHAALKHSCHPCKAGLQTLLSVLSRFPKSLPCHGCTAAPLHQHGSGLEQGAQDAPGTSSGSRTVAAAGAAPATMPHNLASVVTACDI